MCFSNTCNPPDQCVSRPEPQCWRAACCSRAQKGNLGGCRVYLMVPWCHLVVQLGEGVELLAVLCDGAGVQVGVACAQSFLAWSLAAQW